MKLSIIRAVQTSNETYEARESIAQKMEDGHRQQGRAGLHRESHAHPDARRGLFALQEGLGTRRTSIPARSSG